METVMTDEPIEPISASADGKRNAYCLSCKVVQQKMNYAACLHRQRVIAARGDVPRDWQQCDTPACMARVMRFEEETAGKAIYFAPRGTLATAAATAGRWVMDAVKKAVAPAPAAPRAKKDLFDGLGAAGSMADAINAMSEGDKRATSPAPIPLTALPKAQPGESPLQMARRLAAAQKGATGA